MIALLFNPLTRRVGMGLAVVFALAIYGWQKERAGYQRATAEYEAALTAAANQTMEAINNAPDYIPDDPDALRLLCAVAGITDCHLHRNAESAD